MVYRTSVTISIPLGAVGTRCKVGEEIALDEYLQQSWARNGARNGDGDEDRGCEPQDNTSGFLEIVL